MNRRIGAWVLSSALTVLGLAMPAGAQAATTNFTCRASAAAVSLGPQTIDPLVANNDNDPCKSAGATVPSLAAKDALGPNTVDAVSQTAFAITALGNEGGPVYNQIASSQAGIENLDLNLGGGALHIQAQALYSAAGAKCSAPNGTVQFPTYVKLIGLTVNDQKVVGGEDASIPISSSLTSAFDQLSDSPLGGLITVRTEKVYPTATGVTVEAARIELLDASGSPVVTVVLGSAKAGADGAVCTRNADGSDANGNGGSGSGAGSTSGGSTAGSGAGSGGGSGSGAGSGTGTGSGVGTLGQKIKNGKNASTCARMKAFWDLRPHGHLGRSGPHRLTTRYHKRHTIRGRLVNCKGKAITGAKITLYNYVRGNVRLLKTGVKTRKHGEFTMITPNNYKTRRLVFSYRTYLNRPHVAARRTLWIKVLNRRGRVLR